MITSIPLAIKRGNSILFLRLGTLLNQNPEYYRDPNLECLYYTKHQQKADNMQTIIIDSKQPNKDITISPSNNFAVTKDNLIVGTVWSIDNDGTIIIIRVIGYQELKASIFNNTIFMEAEQMRSITPWCYLLIVGAIEYIPAIEGGLVALQELGITISHTIPLSGDQNEEISVRIMQLITKDRSPKRIDPQREFIITTDGEAMLMALPGIGPTKVSLLLHECGSIAWALASLTDPTITTPTITKDQKQKIRTALELDDQSMLSVILLEDKK